VSARILIVDDNATNLKLAATVLELAGFEVAVAEDAERALERIVAACPDLVLMDIALPGMDGLALTRMLRADPRFGRLAIVALSAFAMKTEVDQAVAAGCDGYLTKPIDTRQFAAQVANFLPTGERS
jgi:CheY-like chemotaxis protein